MHKVTVMESDEGQEVSCLLQFIFTVHQEYLHTVNALLAVVPLLFVWLFQTAASQRELLNR